MHSQYLHWWLVAHMIVKTLGSACLLLEIRWQKGRQADKICFSLGSLPRFFFMCATQVLDAAMEDD